MKYARRPSTRREPDGGKRRAQMERKYRFLRPSGYETRITAFVSVVFAVGAQGTHNQKPPPGPPLLPPDRRFPARCGAAWGGYGAACAAAVPRAGNTACWVFNQPRITQHGFSPAPPATPRRATSTPDNGFSAKHESRVTKHGFLVFHEPRPSVRWFDTPETSRYDQIVVASSQNALVAQLDRASGYEPEGREFESLRARHLSFRDR